MTSFTFVEIAPMIALFAVLAYGVWVTAGPDGQWQPPLAAWIIPAGLSALFGAFSIATLWQEGLIAVYTNHSQNLWGNQVWFDLLLAVAMSWTLLLPYARRHGTRILPWMIFVFATASIGLLALAARVLYLEARRPKHNA
ncbi:hypothetical protein [Shimia ponticola]|uniref:hypothetical protein n=1 Tax=Shimia ponticola TaxID=2582893 RepID=UPI0011BD9E56|nr:hypothetical protein [Shimia ponticola]